MLSMPYFREYYRNAVVPTLYSATAPLFEFARDEATLLTHRSHPKSAVFDSVSNAVADPVTNYLSYINEKQYLRNLEERGLTQTNPLPDRGHTFELRKYVLSGEMISGSCTSKKYSYSSPITQTMTNIFPGTPAIGGRALLHAVPTPSTSSFEAFAQRAFSRAAPSSAQFQASRFIGELHEGLPRLGTKTLGPLLEAVSFLNSHAARRALRGAGEDTLNVMFGWLPLMTDAISLAKALYRLTAGMDLTDSFNRPIHRSYKEPVRTTMTDSVNYQSTSVRMQDVNLVGTRFSTPPYQSASGNQVGCIFNTRSSTMTTQRQWFEGAFTRFLPSGYDGSRFLDRANVLFNTKLDPLTLWKLSPWSWLIDWTVDISTFLSAHQLGVDQLLFAHYAYAMEETIVTDFLDWEVAPAPGIYSSAWTGTSKGSLVAKTTTKRRIRASPFGFQAGRTTSLSGYQATVLGALALTKL